MLITICVRYYQQFLKNAQVVSYFGREKKKKKEELQLQNTPGFILS